jgi:hypothetical protein
MYIFLRRKWLEDPILGHSEKLITGVAEKAGCPGRKERGLISRASLQAAAIYGRAACSCARVWEKKREAKLEARTIPATPGDAVYI